MTSFSIFSFLFRLLLLAVVVVPRDRNVAEAAGGAWKLMLKSVGISAMHMQLLINNRVIIFDRQDFGQSNVTLPLSLCNPKNGTVDCTAHSVEYNIASNNFRPLVVETDVWCSSGAVNSDGSLIQTGGNENGFKVVRTFSPCSNGQCDWVEIPNGLVGNRWYATNHILPDDRQIIIGGRGQFNYEFYPKTLDPNLYNLPFLSQTNDVGLENNLYPFVFLNVDGFLFIYSNNRAILFDYVSNKVVRNYPKMPGGEPRNYPSTGSSVLLPLNLANATIEAEVLICGGAPKGSFSQSVQGVFIGALNTCGRIKITDTAPQWVMETMPLARVMGDMKLLPDGNVLIINGAAKGCAGWFGATSPVLNPVIYTPNNPIGSRFEVQNPSTIPRVYHSTALVLQDGRVLIGGSNPNPHYNFTGVPFPTELSLEAFSPSYMDLPFAPLKPRVIRPGSQTRVRYGMALRLQFTVPAPLNFTSISVHMLSAPFTTHSFSQSQRLLVLAAGNVVTIGNRLYEVTVTTPGSKILAPSGYYILIVVHQGIPSPGIWVRIM